jgi:uncharacterized protein (DUF58 family)
MPVNIHDLFLSLRRTIVPFVVGAVGASVLGPWLPDALVAEWATVLLASVYYFALRLLEVRVPKVGLLLGGTGVPTYTDPELERRAFEDFIKALVAIEEAGESL